VWWLLLIRFFGGWGIVWPFGTQSQVQRQMSAKSLDDAKWAIALNGIVRFPLTLIYCMVGVALVSFAEEHGCFPGNEELSVNCDLEVPSFFLSFLRLLPSFVSFLPSFNSWSETLTLPQQAPH
jgi:Na+/proline symporter